MYSRFNGNILEVGGSHLSDRFDHSIYQQMMEQKDIKTDKNAVYLLNQTIRFDNLGHASISNMASVVLSLMDEVRFLRNEIHEMKMEYIYFKLSKKHKLFEVRDLLGIIKTYLF